MNKPTVMNKDTFRKKYNIKLDIQRDDLRFAMFYGSITSGRYLEHYENSERRSKFFNLLKAFNDDEIKDLILMLMDKDFTYTDDVWNHYNYDNYDKEDKDDDEYSFYFETLKFRIAKTIYRILYSIELNNNFDEQKLKDFINKNKEVLIDKLNELLPNYEEINEPQYKKQIDLYKCIKKVFQRKDIGILDKAESEKPEIKNEPKKAEPEKAEPEKAKINDEPEKPESEKASIEEAIENMTTETEILMGNLDELFKNEEIIDEINPMKKKGNIRGLSTVPNNQNKNTKLTGKALARSRSLSRVVEHDDLPRDRSDTIEYLYPGNNQKRKSALASISEAFGFNKGAKAGGTRRKRNRRKAKRTRRN